MNDLVGTLHAFGRDRADIDDLLLARSELDEPYLRRWAGPLGVEAKLDEVLAARE